MNNKTSNLALDNNMSTFRLDLNQQRSQALCQTINAHGMMAVADPYGVITEVNDRFCDLTGYSAGELIGENFNLLNSGTHGSSFFKQLWRRISTGQVWRGILCNRDKFGSLFWVDMSITPVTDADGKLVEYIALLTDVTPLMKARNELETERNLVSAATRAGNITIFQEDIETGLCYFLDEGQDKSRMFDKREWVARRVPLSGLCDISEANANPGLSVKLPLYSELENGDFEWFTYQVVREFDDPQDGWQRVVMLRNIDETEVALSSAKESLVSLNRSNEKRNQIYGMIAHELRTPVSAIQMMCDHPTEDTESFRRDIREATTDLMHTLDDMRLLVNPDLKRPLRLSEGLLSEVNRQVMNMVASAFAATNIQLETFNAFPSGQSAVWIKSDLYRIKVAVSNLLKNAAFHSGGRSVWMTNAFRYNSAGETELVWIVGDDGQGLTYESYERLVKPYERGSTSADGTGFGLHITKSWIEEIGGTLSFRPLRRGSEFTISLPYRADRDQAVRSSETLVKQLSAQAPFVIPKGYKILMVEDDRMLRTLGKAVLEKLGAEVTLAEDGVVGLSLIDGDYDLILTDYFMPNMTGVQMITKARSNGVETPIIGVTAATIGDQEGELLEAGACAVLHKPLTAGSMQDALNKLHARGLLSA